MVGRENAVDASFYNLIHQIVSSGRGGKFSDRRSGKREPYASTQRIALRRGPELPDESEFIDVECHDLTRNGFAFFLPNEPDFDSLVAAFGTPPEVIYIAARVTHCSDVLVDASGKVEHLESGFQETVSKDFHRRTAIPMVMIGCEFVERIRR
ncbi:MAG: hypothetical protein V3R99_07720 [Thermoguttaceae bacterium]